MKKSVLLCCLLLAAKSIYPQQAEFAKLTGPYLGQKPPGMTPEIFAPGIVSTKEAREFSGAFSPDGTEYYFFRFGTAPDLMVSRLAGNVWTEPRPAEFDSEFIDNEPHITGDGELFFFCSNRPYPGGGEGRRMTQVWMMRREGAFWGTPRHLLEGMSPSSSARGNIFIGSSIYQLNAEDRLVEIGRLEPDPSVAEAEWLPHQHTCMSSDESFHLFDFKEKLYVSFRTKDGNWGKPVDLGARMNLEGGIMLPTLSPDGKILFFCRQGDIYWVSADVIETLRPKESNFPVLSGPYLGQKPPGMTPKVFAPGFVSTKSGELNSVFSPDGKEFYFSRRGIPGKPSVLMVTRREGDRWAEPQALPFSGTTSDIDLFLCPDNQRLIFCSSRPREGGQEDRMNHDFWVVRRNGSGWSEPEPFAPEAVSPAEDYYPVVTLSGTLYFNSQREGRGTNDIYAAKFSGGSYLPPEKLPAPINTSYREFDGFVSPDEQTILFSSERPGGFGGADIHISFRDGKGGWSEPVNLGPEVNSASSEYGSIISPDSRYFFFTSSKAGNEDIYWVSAEIIERLRPKK